MNSVPVLLKRSMTQLGVFVLFAFSCLTAASAAQGEISGSWQGQIRTPQAEIRILIELAIDESGELSGSLESLDEAPGRKFPIMQITARNGELEFSVAQIRVTYDGRWDIDDDSFHGHMVNPAGRFDLNLARNGQFAAPERVRPQYPTGELPYIVEEVLFSNPSADGVVLAGTLSYPDTSGPVPGVVLVTGSGPQDRDQLVFGHKSFLVLADHLTRAGIAVLRYDDRGIAGSTGDYDSAGTSDFASDTVAAVNYLRSRGDIDVGPLGLIGHSEGGLIAPMAARNSREVDFLVLLAAPGVSTRDVLLTQARTQAQNAGASGEALEFGLSVQAQLIDIAAADTSDQTANARMRDVLTDEVMITMGGQPSARDNLIRHHLSSAYRSLVRTDPAANLLAINVPVLALNGSLDSQVDADENLTGMRAHLVNSQDATILELDGLNHMFQTARTGGLDEYDRIEETFAPSALLVISSWISEQPR